MRFLYAFFVTSLYDFLVLRVTPLRNRVGLVIRSKWGFMFALMPWSSILRAFLFPSLTSALMRKLSWRSHALLNAEPCPHSQPSLMLFVVPGRTTKNAETCSENGVLTFMGSNNEIYCACNIGWKGRLCDKPFSEKVRSAGRRAPCRFSALPICETLIPRANSAGFSGFDSGSLCSLQRPALGACACAFCVQRIVLQSGACAWLRHCPRFLAQLVPLLRTFSVETRTAVHAAHSNEIHSHTRTTKTGLGAPAAVHARDRHQERYVRGGAQVHRLADGRAAVLVRQGQRERSVPGPRQAECMCLRACCVLFARCFFEGVACGVCVRSLTPVFAFL